MSRVVTRVVSLTLAVVLAVVGALVGMQFAPPLPGSTVSIVKTTVAGTSATRLALVGTTSDAIREDALDLLREASSSLDPAPAAALLAPRFKLWGSDDACAVSSSSGSDCPVASVSAVERLETPRLATVTGTGRPPTFVYPVTDDLIGVTVSHLRGETVAVYPSVVDGARSSQCDHDVSGTDLFVHELGRVETTLADSQLGGYFAEYAHRTTVAFDINEGLTVSLCIEITPAAGGEPSLTTGAIVRTADRLVPAVAIEGVSGQYSQGWSVRGYLPNGQRCGAWDVRGIGAVDPGHVLCDTSDVLAAVASDGPVGRGVLPFSIGDHATFTIEQSYTGRPPVRTSLNLGRAALCTGGCIVPPAQRFDLSSPTGSLAVRVDWSQGNSNGAAATTVTMLERVDGSALDTAASNVRQTAFDVGSRAAEASLTLQVSTPASYVATLQGSCTRPGAELTSSGSVDDPVEVTFGGLCAGADYAVHVQLTDTAGLVTEWNLGTLHIRERIVALTVDYRLVSDAYFFGVSDQAAYLTLRSGDLDLVGPHAGECFGPLPEFTGSTTGSVPLAENVHLTGSVQTATALVDNGCDIQWATSRLALTFAVDFTLEQLLAAPNGLTFRVDQPVGADAATLATASAIITVRAAG